MFQTFISRHNSNFFSDKLVLTSVTPASSAPVLQTPKATSSTLYRSEERFRRNAETDLVCRLLLEKNKLSLQLHFITKLDFGNRLASSRFLRYITLMGSMSVNTDRCG